MFQSGVRASMSPIVFFQWFMWAMSSPSTQQPPGKRRNFGRSASSASAMSTRNPWFFHVWSGIKDSMSRYNRPLPSPEMRRRALGSLLEAVRRAEWYLHPASMPLISLDASSPPLELTSRTLKGPLKPSVDRAASLNE